ncbi:protein Wnt-10a [Pectinophora gossypiella]|uniref:protein Wnt-10a n=1 Tax=Pectinophora gossypiella TaxID=13191 RepID=UPI00214EE53D|nr:protein Wnt-10a [Pectinophora gossypiella]
MKKLRTNWDRHRMREIFPVAIVFLLFFLLKMASSRNNMLPLPNHLKLNSALTCRLVGGLTREQRAVCHEAPDTAAIAFEGLQLAVRECQHQFRWHRWNCSNLAVKSANPHASSIMKRGIREAAFLYALTAAGVAHAVARACAQGRLLSCGCDPLGYRASHDPRGRARGNKWEWSGCSHNLAYGMEFSRRFLDAREQDDDLQSRINVHNNNAGRSILSSHMEVRCKCHGLSGSCQLQTCWRATPDFRVVASTIKRQYRKALTVAQEELNDGMSTLLGRPRGKRRSRARPAPRTSLLFFERSPSFCEPDPRTDSLGTSGRVCRVGRTRSGSCDVLCCDRGHAFIRKSSIKPCNCTFHWCCRVDCQKCRDDKWVAICK